MPTLRGKLLIASPRLDDPNFAQAVVLLVQHDDDGALGLVLNRPLELSVKQAIEEAVGETLEADFPLHQGGPCDGPLMCLHDDASRSQIDIGEGVHFSADRDDVESLLRQPGEQVRFFVGYAGWVAGQLEAELETGSWLQTRAPTRNVFVHDARQWNKWVTILTGELDVLPDALPDDPSLN